MIFFIYIFSNICVEGHKVILILHHTINKTRNENPKKKKNKDMKSMGGQKLTSTVVTIEQNVEN